MILLDTETKYSEDTFISESKFQNHFSPNKTELKVKLKEKPATVN